MQGKVTCTLNLTAELTEVNRLKEAVFERGLRGMAEVRARALAARDERSEKVCPECSGHHLVADGTGPHRLRSRLGTVGLRRRQDRCPNCGRSVRPVEKRLRGAGPGRATRGLVKLAVLVAASGPFATAATGRNRLCGATVRAEWVREGAEAAGKAQAEQPHELARAVLERRAEVEPLTESPQRLGDLDGYGGKSRQTPEGLACKVGGVASGQEKTSKERFTLRLCRNRRG